MRCSRFDDRRSRRCALAALFAFCVMTNARAQTPLIHDREIIDYGTPGYQVWGSCVAASPRHRLAVCTSGVTTHSTYLPDVAWLIRAQSSDDALPGWTSTEIAPCPQGAGGWEWASVAYNRTTYEGARDFGNESFLIAAQFNGGLFVSHYTPGFGFDCTSPCTGAPSGNWTPLGVAPQGHNYKPWVVAGEPNEFYVVSSHAPPPFIVTQMLYARSTDGGCSWHGGVISDAQGDPIISSFPVQPAMASDGRLYIARNLPYSLLFAIGEKSGDLVSFSEMLDENGFPVQIVWSFLEPDYPPIALPNGSSMEVIRAPYLIADPTNPGRLYVLYHDSASADTQSPGYDDLNVYLVTLRRDGANGAWHVSPRVRINTGIDEPGAHSDQWMPVGAVDRFGRLHVIFYDNSSHGECGAPPPAHRYDVIYALSTDHGASFTNYNTRTCDQRVPLDLDYALQQNHDPLWSPHEYNGLAVASTDDETTVWATYAGVSSQDPDAIKTVIFASKITLANPR
jgi:hypothetical protein